MPAKLIVDAPLLETVQKGMDHGCVLVLPLTFHNAGARLATVGDLRVRLKGPDGYHEIGHWRATFETLSVESGTFDKSRKLLPAPFALANGEDRLVNAAFGMEGLDPDVPKPEKYTVEVEAFAKGYLGGRKWIRLLSFTSVTLADARTWDALRTGTGLGMLTPRT